MCTRFTVPPLTFVFFVVAVALTCFTGTYAPAKDTVYKVRVQQDLTYASKDGVDLRCDVYSPSQESIGSGNARYPAVAVIHGGAWSSGSKLVMANYASKLAEIGIIAVAIDYRHAPLHKFPAQVDDLRDALVWMNKNAEEYLIDLSRVGLFGYSAGGHLACLMATLEDESLERKLTTSEWEADDPRWHQIPKIQCVVAGGPPCEFRDLPPNNTGLAFFLGGSRAERPEVYAAASPVSFASNGDCPICFVHGDKDFIVPIKSSRCLFEAQIESGVQCEFVVVDKQGHMITFLHPKLTDSLLDFMKRKLLDPI